MRTILFAVLLGISAAATAAEAPKKPADVTIEADKLNRATAANLQRQAAERILKATEKAGKLGIVVQPEGPEGTKAEPPMVLEPSDPEWKAVLELARKLAQDRYAKADKILKDLGVTVTP